jgi:signal transduction histidine kinase
VIAVSTNEPVAYLVFPALIWAAFRFGPPGATLSIAIAASLAIVITAAELGPFAKQAIDDRALSTQLYVIVAVLTTLSLSALVTERERSVLALAEARRHEGERAVEERHRIARDLHDSVSQALFSTVLHTRTAQRAIADENGHTAAEVGQALTAIGELTRGVQSEIRELIFELNRDAVDDGLVTAIQRHTRKLGAQDGLAIEVRGPEGRLDLSPRTESQLFGITREALANVVKHAEAQTAWVRVVDGPGRVVVEVRDDGHGFDPVGVHAGHFGLESMRSRASEIGGLLTISSSPGSGTVVRVDAPSERRAPDVR